MANATPIRQRRLWSVNWGVVIAAEIAVIVTFFALGIW